MNKIKVLLLSIMIVFTSNASAQLVERLNGLAYYDDVNNITWLADAYAAGGAMSWTDANSWATSLNVNGITGWRLPDTLQPDLNCSGQNGGGGSYGTNCTGSELGNLYYNILGGSAGSTIFDVHNDNYNLFSNIQNSYWTSGENLSVQAWAFYFTGGNQSALNQGAQLSAWAVHSGDVSAVPVPMASWLFVSGLAGLIGVAKCKKV